MDITTTCKTALSATKTFVKVNSHTIKAAAAMGGVLAVAKTSYDAYPILHTELEEAEKEKGKPLTKTERIIIMAKAFWKAGLAVTFTEALILASIFDANGKILAASAVAALNKEKLEEWKESAADILGKKKVEEIDEKVAEKEIMKGYPMYNAMYDMDGKYWIKEDITGRFFRDTEEGVKTKIALIAGKLGGAFEDEIPVSDFFCMVDLDTEPAASEAYVFHTSNRREMTDAHLLSGLFKYCKGPDGRPAAYFLLSKLVTDPNCKKWY